MTIHQNHSSFLPHPSSFLSRLLDVCYLAMFALALPWLVYRRLRHGKYRAGWKAKFWGCVPRRAGDKPCLWFHAVSVGEVNLLEPLLKRWERQYPDWECVISTTTETGYQLAQKRYAPRMVIYAPLDFSWAVRRAMRRIRPRLLVLAELELWPNLIAAARLHGAEVAIVNGRLGERSFRGYRRLSWLVRGTLAQVGLIAAQNQEYADRFCQLGASAAAVHVTGSVKFDGARTNRHADEVDRLTRLAGIESGDIVFLAGSTQAPEESIALDAFAQLAAELPRLRLILVPRHPERFEEVAALLDRRRIAYARRSQLPAIFQSSSDRPRVLLVDAVGELGHWWGTARIAFVGGSLTRRGGQNMIEPAGYGAAIAFGPNTWNFRDVVALFLDRQAAIVVRDRTELIAFVRRCLADPLFAADLGRRAQQLVLEQQGAADRTIARLAALAGQPARSAKSAA